MDKYEFKLKVDEMKALVSARNYNAAAEIAETVNWRKIRNLNALVLAGEIFEQVERYEESKEILLMAYDKSPIGRNIIYRLAEIAIKTKNFVEAKEYYDEFVDIAPHDNLKFVLKYKMTAAQGLSYQEQIKILEELKEQEYSEEWAYELAYLYHRDRQPDKCVEACDELILWFGDGIYVEKALELKMQYQPLTKTQEEKYRLFRQKRTGVIEVKPEDFLESGEIVNEAVKIPSVIENPGKFNTANLENEIVRGMQQIIDAKEKKDVSNAMDQIKKAVEAIPYLSRQEEAWKKDEELEPELEPEPELRLEPERYPEPEQHPEPEPEEPAASMTIEEILADWEKTKQATQEALRKADGRKLESAKEKALHDAESLMDRLIEVIPQLTAETAQKELSEKEYLQEDEILEQNNADQVQDDIEEASRIVAGMNKILQEQIDALTAKAKPHRVTDPTRELPELPVEEVTDIETYNEAPITAETPAAAEASIAASEENRAVKDSEPEIDMKKLEEQLTKAVEPEIQPEAAEENRKAEFLNEKVTETESSLETGIGYQREFSLESEKEEDEQVILKGRLKIQTRAQVPEIEAESEKEIAEYKDSKEQIETAERAENIENEESTEYGESTEREVSSIAYEENIEREESIKNAQNIKYEESIENEENIEYEESIENMQNIGYGKNITDVKNVKREENIENAQNTKLEENITDVKSIKEIESREERFFSEQLNSNPKSIEYQRIQETDVPDKRLTTEQKEIFSFFISVEGMEAQIYDLLQSITKHLQLDKNSMSGNIIVEGINGSGKTTLVKNIIKVLQNELNHPNRKIGKIDANALNQKKLDVLIEKVSGGCLIIESAGRITRETAVKLSQCMEKDRSGTIYILEDTPEGIQKALERDSSFAAKFTEKISIPLYTNDELIVFGKIYANELDYDIDEMGILALYKRIESMQKADDVITLAEVIEIMDEAIDNAERGALKKVLSILTSTRYSDNNRVILREKDFEA